MEWNFHFYMIHHVNYFCNVKMWTPKWSLFYNKLLFYSVISNYCTLCLLGKIKKTGTVLDRRDLSGLKNCLMSGVLNHCCLLRIVSLWWINHWLLIIHDWIYCFNLDRSFSWVCLKIQSWVCCRRWLRTAKIPLWSESMCSGEFVVEMVLSMLQASHNSRVVVHIACWILDSTLIESIVRWYWLRYCVHCLVICP